MLVEILPQIENPRTATWVRDVYLKKYQENHDSYWYGMSVEEFERYLTLMKLSEMGRKELIKHRERIREHIDRLSNPYSRPPKERLQELRDLLDSVQPNEPPP